MPPAPPLGPGRRQKGRQLHPYLHTTARNTLDGVSLSPAAPLLLPFHPWSTPHSAESRRVSRNKSAPIIPPPAVPTASACCDSAESRPVAGADVGDRGASGRQTYQSAAPPRHSHRQNSSQRRPGG